MKSETKKQTQKQKEAPPRYAGVPATFPAADFEASGAYTNPLRGLSVADTENIFDMARRGSYARLQRIYSEIEENDPVLLPCVQKRIGGITETALSAEPKDARDGGSLAEEQAAALREECLGADNLDDALEHLALSFFRGFSHLVPLHDSGGRLAHFDLPPHAAFCRDIGTGEWLWNETISDSPHGLPVIPADEIITLSDRPAIDRPVMRLHIRASFSERDWGRYVERFGVPRPVVTMPQFANRKEEQDYLDAGVAFGSGETLALPYGSNVSFPAGNVGTQPFEPHLGYIEKRIVMLSTGGILTTLAEAGSGTLAGGAHLEIWNRILARDRRIIAALLNRRLGAPVLSRRFPGRKALAEIRFDTSAEMTADKVLDLAVKAKSAGLAMDPQEISRDAGYTITAAPEAAPAPQPFGEVLNSAEAGPAQLLASASLTDQEAAQKFIRESKSADDALKKFAKWLKLRAPAKAAAIESAMREGVAPDAELHEVKNYNPDQPRDAGQFSHTQGAHGEKREPQTKAKSDSLGALYDPEHPGQYSAKDNIKRGEKAVDRALRQKASVKNAMYRPELGHIDFDWGNAGTPANKYEDGSGLAHIEHKHPGMSRKLPSLIQNGTVHKMPLEMKSDGTPQAQRYAVVHGDTVAFIDEHGKGGKSSFVVSSYIRRPANIDKIKANPLAKPRGSKGG